MFHLRWISTPAPKPFYHKEMNPEERVIWEIVGQIKTTSFFNTKGNLKTRRLSKVERARNQKTFFDTRCGHGIFGDDWMRHNLNESKRKNRG